MTNQRDELHDSQVQLHGLRPEKRRILFFSAKALQFAIFIIFE